MTWDDYFLKIAKSVSFKSKDPNTKVGAVIVGSDNQIISTGFNGFPRGIDEDSPDRWERPEKYRHVEHAELNAIFNSARTGVSTKGTTLYLYGFQLPCSRCAGGIIQSGIQRVVCFGEVNAPWADDLSFSKDRLLEAGVVVETV